MVVEICIGPSSVVLFRDGKFTMYCMHHDLIYTNPMTLSHDMEWYVCDIHKLYDIPVLRSILSWKGLWSNLSEDKLLV